MTLRGLFSRPATWWTVAAAAGIALCAAALNNGVYEATSPTSLDYHVYLRKFYSVVAFAVVGYPIARARQAAGRFDSPLIVGWMVAAYSATIEVLQYFFDPPPEGFASNLLDVACGFAGGTIAAFAASRMRRPA